MRRDPDNTSQHDSNMPQSIELAEAIGFLYQHRQRIADGLRAGRKERFLDAFDELIAMHIQQTVTLLDLIAREHDFESGDQYLLRRIANRIHRRHSRAREDMLNWICRQEKFGRQREQLNAAHANGLRWCVATALCGRQSSRRVARALGIE